MCGPKEWKANGLPALAAVIGNAPGAFWARLPNMEDLPHAKLHNKVKGLRESMTYWLKKNELCYSVERYAETPGTHVHVVGWSTRPGVIQPLYPDRLARMQREALNSLDYYAERLALAWDPRLVNDYPADTIQDRVHFDLLPGWRNLEYRERDQTQHEAADEVVDYLAQNYTSPAGFDDHLELNRSKTGPVAWTGGFFRDQTWAEVKRR